MSATPSGAPYTDWDMGFSMAFVVVVVVVVIVATIITLAAQPGRVSVKGLRPWER